MADGFTSATFIGRAVEMGRLDAALDRAEQGRPQVVLLAGDAGVGGHERGRHGLRPGPAC